MTNERLYSVIRSFSNYEDSVFDFDSSYLEEFLGNDLGLSGFAFLIALFGKKAFSPYTELRNHYGVHNGDILYSAFEWLQANTEWKFFDLPDLYVFANFLHYGDGYDLFISQELMDECDCSSEEEFCDKMQNSSFLEAALENMLSGLLPKYNDSYISYVQECPSDYFFTLSNPRVANYLHSFGNKLPDRESFLLNLIVHNSLIYSDFNSTEVIEPETGLIAFCGYTAAFIDGYTELCEWDYGWNVSSLLAMYLLDNLAKEWKEVGVCQ